MASRRSRQIRNDKRYSCTRCPDTEFDRLRRGISQLHRKYSLEDHVKTVHPDVNKDNWESLQRDLAPVPRRTLRVTQCERAPTPTTTTPLASTSEANSNTQTPAHAEHGGLQLLAAAANMVNEDVEGVEDEAIPEEAIQQNQPLYATNLTTFDVNALYNLYGEDMRAMAASAFPNDPNAAVFDAAAADEGSVNMIGYLQAKGATLEAYLGGWQQDSEALRASNIEKDREILALGASELAKDQEIRRAVAAQQELLRALEANGLRPQE